MKTETMAEWHRAIAIETKKHAKAKRGGVNRYPCGQIVHRDREPEETQEQRLATATAQPHRRGAKDPRSPFLGYALGRLKLIGREGGVDPDQYTAGDYYTRITVAYLRHVVTNTPRFGSTLANEIAGADNSELTPERIAAIRDAHATMMGWLADTGEMYDVNRVLFALCVMDREPRGVREMGWVRIGLNAIHRRIAGELDKSARIASTMT